MWPTIEQRPLPNTVCSLEQGRQSIWNMCPLKCNFSYAHFNILIMLQRHQAVHADLNVSANVWRRQHRTRPGMPWAPVTQSQAATGHACRSRARSRPLGALSSHSHCLTLQSVICAQQSDTVTCGQSSVCSSDHWH